MKYITWIICLVWLGAMTWLQGISRSDFALLWGVYALAFGLYALLISGKINITLQTGLLLALLARLLSLFFEPLLSDDYYRFIWDGMLIHQGIHPMAYTPLYLMQHPEITTVDQHLFGLLNSQNYYSVYPPAAQWIFGLSYWLNGLSIGGQILFYKCLLIMADGLIVFFLYHLLKQHKLPFRRILIYALNPLIIMEYTGNLHMDSLMIAGLLGAVALSGRKNVFWSSLMMTFSIISKMLTLVMIPFMPRKLYWGKLSLFGIISLMMSIGIFWYSFGNHSGWIESVKLWFHTFEFNASIYYVIRGLGYFYEGYNIIQKAGPMLALITIGGIGLIWWYYIRKPSADWATAMLSVLTLYFLMSTTVHPWYLGTLLALSVISLHFYPVVWTCLVFLSYSHYQAGGSGENYMLIATEYILLLGWMVWEWQLKKNVSNPANNPVGL